MRFNPPPGWPTPPIGWMPPTGWAPDASWPTPPDGWQLFVHDDEDAKPSNALVANPSESESAAEAQPRTAEAPIPVAPPATEVVLAPIPSLEGAPAAARGGGTPSGVIELSDQRILQDVGIY